MYIHRLVIDANCINAKRRMDAMNELEEYHKSGLIEIFKTSTLNKEFRTAPLQNEKAKEYQMLVGTNSLDGDMKDTWMPIIQKCNFEEYYKEIFGWSSKYCRRSMRDCEHIDQAIMNNVDYFVTNEKKLIEAGTDVKSIYENIKILSPEDCLSEIKSFLESSYGSSNIEILKKRFLSEGEVLLGSNSMNGMKLVDPVTSETILSFWNSGGYLVINAIVRNENGDLIAEVYQEKIVFHTDSGMANCFGRGPIIICNKNYLQVCISENNHVYISVRQLSSGKILFDRVNLHSQDGKRKIQINRGEMMIKGLTF